MVPRLLRRKKMESEPAKSLERRPHPSSLRSSFARRRHRRSTTSGALLSRFLRRRPSAGGKRVPSLWHDPTLVWTKHSTRLATRQPSPDHSVGPNFPASWVG